jgi:hypothetical protein
VTAQHARKKLGGSRTGCAPPRRSCRRASTPSSSKTRQTLLRDKVASAVLDQSETSWLALKVRDE